MFPYVTAYGLVEGLPMMRLRRRNISASQRINMIDNNSKLGNTLKTLNQSKFYNCYFGMEMVKDYLGTQEPELIREINGDYYFKNGNRICLLSKEGDMEIVSRFNNVYKNIIF